MQHGFEERSITQFARGPSLGMFGHLQHGLKLLPDGFADDFAHGMFEHPKLQSLLRTFVHFIIREHSLEQFWFSFVARLRAIAARPIGIRRFRWLTPLANGGRPSGPGTHYALRIACGRALRASAFWGKLPRHYAAHAFFLGSTVGVRSLR
jgi:hypothetical protein